MISIIIPTLNRQKLLEKSIKAILNNTEKPDEIIIIEQWNIEKTKEILKNINFNFKIYFLDEKSASKARNFWVKKSSWSILLFIDDDLQIDKDYIKKAYDYLKENESVKIVSWRDKNAFIPKINFFKKMIRVLTYQDIFWNKRIVLKNGQNIVRLNFDKIVDSQWASGTMIVKKEVFEFFSFPWNFERWSFWEDVFFSYQVFKKYWEWSIKFIPDLIFNHIKSNQNRITTGSEIKMMIIYRYIFWKTCLYNNSYLNLFFYIYWEFFRWLYIWKTKKWNLKIVFNTWKYLFKNYKKINNNTIKYNDFILK